MNTENLPHPVPAAPAAPVDYTPLVAEEIIKSGDECWADKVGPWTKVSEARVGESYKPWNGDTGWHLPMRRPSHSGSASTGAPTCPDCGACFWITGTSGTRHCIECLVRMVEARAASTGEDGQ
jgi:hypothetical protein